MTFVLFRGIEYQIKKGVLKLINKDITDIEEIKGLENLENLIELNLYNNQISEIKGLESLNYLQKLILDHNNINKITGLNALNKLKVLSLHGNNVEKIENLNPLENLTGLDLSENEISEIEGLETLVNLEKLSLYNNKFEEIKGLNKCKKLKELWLRRNRISTIKGIDELHNLNLLDLSFNQIIEISGLENLKELKKLNLEENFLKELKDFDNLTNLEDLNLNGNEIGLINGLGKLINLRILKLSENLIKKIEGLDNLVKLTTLVLSSNKIQKIEKLESNTKLETISLASNRIKKVEGLNYIIDLESLLLSENQFFKIEGLSELTKLKQLDLSRNYIQKIEGLSKLAKLKQLDLSRNFIQTIGGLKKLTYLYDLDISKNIIEEIQGLYSLKLLKILNLDNNKLKSPDDFWGQSSTDAQQIVHHCRRKKRGEIEPIQYYNEKISYIQNLKNFEKELKILKKTKFVKIGTYKEKRNISWKQNKIFFEKHPIMKRLSEIDYSFEKIIIHLIQLHSLKGIKPLLSKSDKSYNRKFFDFFLKHFWDIREINNRALIYKNNSSRVNIKIDEFLDICTKFNLKKYPNLIVFPENTIPYEKVVDLVNFSKINQLIIIGGLEHIKVSDNHYINIAIIIDNGILGYQIKQTPVFIKNKETGEFNFENIICQPTPKIKIFQTSIGNISIFICKDFLRLSRIISDWSFKNDIDYIIIPSLTSKVLPFLSKLLNIFNYTDYKELKIIFNNVGEYGGSEFFTINGVKKIERSYKINSRDNVGEIIVVREFKSP